LELSEKLDLSDKFKYSELSYFMGTIMAKDMSCCKVDAVITIDAKGQLVLPKDVREKAGLKPNDKLAVIGCEDKGETCCIMLVKAERIENSVREALGPMLKEIFK
jgi:AbrB family looped-hinge helix DNA binding protein